jgi:RecB family endonuclease NucS
MSFKTEQRIRNFDQKKFEEGKEKNFRWHRKMQSIENRLNDVNAYFNETVDTLTMWSRPIIKEWNQEVGDVRVLISEGRKGMAEVKVQKLMGKAKEMLKRYWVDTEEFSLPE